MESNVSKSRIKEEMRRRWNAEAVDLALQGRWDEAAQVNLRILEMFPEDISARNRLGKAYWELDRLAEAAETYEESLQRQPSNPIARKSLMSLYPLLNRDPATLTERVVETSVSEEGDEELDNGEEDELEDLDDSSD